MTTLNVHLLLTVFLELSMTQNQSAERETYIQLLHEIYLKQNRIGYYFLFYIHFMSLKLNADRQPVGATASTGAPFNKSPTAEILTLIKIYGEFTKDRQTEIRSELRSKQSQGNQPSSSDDAHDSDSDSDLSSGSESDTQDQRWVIAI